MTDLAAHLALGTAQLGMPYGVANVEGQPDRGVAYEIVATCWEHGVRFFDTAQVYGESEEILGECIRRMGAADEVRVITKLHPDADLSDAAGIVRRVEESLQRLGVPKLWGLLLHREAQLDEWGGALGEALRESRRRGLVVHLGASVHSPERAIEAIRSSRLEAIQVATSVFDRRMTRAHIMRKARDSGTAVFIRSVFLQGLALMDPQSLPVSMAFARRAVESFAEFCGERGYDRREFAVAYARRVAPESTLVIGAESPEQAEFNCTLFGRVAVDDASCEEWDQQWPNDVAALVDPSQWPTA